MDISKQRNALKKLRRVNFDRTNGVHLAMAPQEMLDFLAMLEGIKPAYLLGRGFSDSNWIEGVRVIAKAMGLKAIPGRGWITDEGVVNKPAWFMEMTEAKDDGSTKYHYICKAPAVAAKLEGLCTQDIIPVESEAQMLGYPVCCVAHYHQQQKAFDEMFFGKIERAANGDIEEMKRIIRDDDQFTADTPEEEELFRAKFEMRPAPFTSVNMCPDCFAAPSSPAKLLSRKYEELAKRIDPELAAEIAYYQAPMIASSQ